MEKDSYYKMVIANSVNADGSDTFDVIRYENEGSSTGLGALIDQYEYVMHGKGHRTVSCFPIGYDAITIIFVNRR